MFDGEGSRTGRVTMMTVAATLRLSLIILARSLRKREEINRCRQH
jgi:hypothetical protein